MLRSVLGPLPDSCEEIYQDLEEFANADRREDSDSRKISEWNGYRFPVPFSGETAKDLYDNYEFCDNSVIIATYCKTGTTWTTEIVRQILYGRDETLNQVSNIASGQVFSYLEVWKAKKMELLKFLPLPRKIHVTHLPEALINFAKVKRSKSKIILTVRNPKDQLVSWFHFVRGPYFGHMADHYSHDWPQFFADAMKGKYPMPGTRFGEGYAEYLQNWVTKWGDDENLLLVHFEKLKNNPKAEIQRIAEFIKVDLTKDDINDIADKTTFRTMKKNLEQGDTERAKILKKTNLMRKGDVGSWKEIMTVAQSEAVDEMIKEKLEQTNIKFIYE